MEIDVNKIHGTISEVKTARFFLSEAIGKADKKHKWSLDKLNKSFSEIESTLFCLIETKTHRRHQTTSLKAYGHDLLRAYIPKQQDVNDAAQQRN